MAKHRREDDTTPSSPISTPPRSGPDWAMQAFTDLKVSVVSMEASIKALTDTVKELKDEHAKVKGKLSTVEKQIYAALAVLAIVGYVGNKAIDFGMDMAKRSVYSQTVPATALPQLIQQPVQQVQPVQPQQAPQTR